MEIFLAMEVDGKNYAIMMKLEVTAVEKLFIEKMIENCFKQYGSDMELLPIDAQEMELLYYQVLWGKEAEPEADLYEIVNDAVYEFLTSWEK